MLADSHSGRRVKSVRVPGVVLLKGRSTLWGTRSTADVRVKACGAAPDEVGGGRREVKQEDERQSGRKSNESITWNLCAKRIDLRRDFVV